MNIGRLQNLILTAMVAFGMQFPVATDMCARAAEAKTTKSSSGCNCNCGTKCSCCCSKKKTTPDGTPKPSAPKGCSCGQDKAPATPAPVVVEEGGSKLATPVLSKTFLPAAGTSCDVIRPTAHGPPGSCLILKTTILQV